MLSEISAFEQIEPLLSRLWPCHSRAFQKYREDPYRHLHRKATRASVISDLIFAEVIMEFDEVPGVATIQSGIDQLRYLSVSDTLNLWFKKMDDDRNSANYPTRRARMRDRGQTGLFGEEPSFVLAGYQLNQEETDIKCLCFAPPKRFRPRWWIEVREVRSVLEMKPAQKSTGGFDLIVRRSSQQSQIG